MLTLVKARWTAVSLRLMVERGDALMSDRWRWVEAELATLPRGPLLDAGCGNGFTTMNAAARGFESLGLGWSQVEMRKATNRASAMGLQARFESQDLRQLHRREDLEAEFSAVVCMEVIEHILDDRKLLRDLRNTLLPGGVILLTSPNYDFIPLDGDEADPDPLEDGGHVRRGYREADLRALCDEIGLEVVRVAFCSGWASQRLTGFERRVRRLLAGATPAMTLPLRTIARRYDARSSRHSSHPPYSITLVARRRAVDA